MTSTVKRNGVWGSGSCFAIGLLGLLGATACGPREPEANHSHETVEQISSAVWVNGGFESDAIGAVPSGWTGETYLNKGITQVTPQTLASLNLMTGGVAATQIVGGAAESQADPNLGTGASLRYPKYGIRSAVLNYKPPTNGDNYNVNALRQTMTAALGDVDPSDSKVHVRFAIAPVLENPSHGYTQQPYYFVRLQNLTKNVTLYQDFNVSAQTGVPWKIANSIYYTDWQVVDVAPGNATLAVGDQVEILVIASGCAAGGHWGRVYVDAFGSSIPGIYVSATGPQSANQSADITYNVTYANGAGATASGTTVSMDVPAGTTFRSVSTPASCTAPAVGGTGTITCTIGTLAAGSAGSFTVTVRVNATATGIITNGTYSIAATGVTPILGPKVQTTVTSSVSYANVSVTKDDGVAAVGWGQPLTYTVRLTNAGPATAPAVTVTDTMPAQLTGVTWTCAATGGGSCPASGSGNISTSAVALPSGATATFTVAATVIAGSGTGSVSNTVTTSVGGGATDPDTTDNAANDTDAIGTLRTLSITKTGAAGGTITSAPAEISCGTGCSSDSGQFVEGSQVVLTATPVAGASFTSWGGACAGSTNTCTLTISGNQTVTAAFVPPSTISVSSGSGQSASTGAAFAAPLVALVVDGNGTPVSGATVVFAAPGSGASATLSAATATTNAQGLASITATANATAGSYTVSAGISGTAAATTFSLSNHGAANTITVSSGSGQTTAVGTAFAAPLVAIVKDSGGIVVPGVLVTFSLSGIGASASLSAISGTTDAAGTVSITATANTIAGSHTVNASVSGVATPATFSLTNTAGAAALISITGGNGQSAAAGAAFTTPLLVTIVDAYGNPVSGVTVSFAAIPTAGASATLSAASGVSNASGQVQVTATANTTAGSYSVAASAAGGPPTVTFSLTNTAGAASSIAVSAGSGQTTTINTAFAMPLVARVVDAYGNVKAGVAVSFSAPGSGASAALSAASATTGATGTASVTATANGTAGSYNVTASTAGVAAGALFALTNQQTLALSPAAPTVAPRASLTFTATGGSSTGYAFSLTSAPSGGTIDANTGMYHAGATPNVVDVVSVTDSQGHTATANVTVGPGLTLTADKPLVPPRGSAVFTPAGGSGSGFIFVISTNHSNGTIDAAGNYTAGANDSVTDTVTVTDLVGNIATATINIGPAIALTASATRTPPRGSLTFSATGGNLAGYVFSLATNASGGTINATTGAYTAGSMPGVIDVVSVSDALGNVATANVNVGAGITISPPSPSVAPLGHQTFGAAGGSGTGYAFALATNASGGTIDAASGAYVAGSTPNKTDLIKVTDSLGNTATASVSVGGGITVSPSSLTAPPRATQTFIANGGSTAGFTFTLLTNGSGGSINASTGVYVAGNTGSTTDVIKITDSLGNQTTVTVMVTAGLQVMPGTATRAPLGHVAFMVSGGSGSGYAFTVSTSPSGGTVVSSTGDYAAGSIGNVTDVVTVVDSLGNKATATIMVTAALQAMAPMASVPPRGTTTLAATAGAGPYVFALTANGSGGTIDPNTGVYVAGGRPLSTDVVTITDANGATTSVVISVGRGIAVVPALPAAPPRGLIAFGATGGSGTGYVYTLLMSPSGGTIDAATGAYVAGPTGNVADVVSVTDSLGNTAQVTIAVGGKLALNPSSPRAAPQEPIAFAVVGGSGSGYTFALDPNGSGGTIDATTGAYVAGTTGDASDVVTVTDSLGNTATTTITVGPVLTIVPEIAQRTPQQSTQFTARGGSGTGYIFALSTNASHATIDDTGLYTAGPTGNVNDVVTVTDSLGNTATAHVTVGQGVILTSSSETVPPRGSARIMASGGSLGGYTFVLRSNGSGGSVVATTGDYLAGDSPNTMDIIEATDAFGNTGVITILVGPGVSVTPSAPAVAPRGAVMLVATGGSNTGFTFTFESNESGATLDSASGAYVAGNDPSAVDVVVATDSLGNSATVSIAVGTGLAVNPTHASVPPHGTLQLFAAGGSGTGYRFAVTVDASSGATVDAMGGLYTAGGDGNVDDVVTVIDSLGNTGTATISVTDGLRIMPGKLDLAPLGQATFSASGGSGSGYTFALVTNGSGGAVDASSGSYVAGAQGSTTDVIKVTDSLGNAATAEVHVGAALAVSLPTGAGATTPPRGTVMLTVTGGASGVTFQLSSNKSGGTVNPATGVYVAGAAGTTTDTVKAVDGNGAVAMLTVQVGPGVTIAPVAGPLGAGHHETLVASGGSGTGYRWTLVAAGSGGSIDPDSGAYVAGPHLGGDVIEVKDSLGNSSQIQLDILGSSNGATAYDLRGGGLTCSIGTTGGGGPGSNLLGVLALAGAAAMILRRRPRPRPRPGRAARVRARARKGGPLLALAVAGGLAAGAAGGVARAQTAAAGFAIDQFTPAERGSEWFVLDSLDIHGDERTAVGLSTSWAYRPLILVDADGGVRQSVVSSQLVSHLGASLILVNRLRLGVDVPFQLFGGGQGTSVSGVDYGSPASTSSLGDIRVSATARLFDYASGHLTGAFGVSVALPTGDQSSYAGDPGVGVIPRALLAGRAGRVVYAAQLGASIRKGAAFASTYVGSDLFLGASAGVRFLDDKLLVGPELFGRSVLADGVFLDKRATPLELMLGAHLTVARDWRVGAGVSGGLTGGIGNPTTRGLVSLEWAPGAAVAPPDRDFDGILDVADACPSVAGVASSEPARNGCPPAPADRDRDGIADAADACPTKSGPASADPAKNGCPLPPPPAPDADQDGIADASDACPREPGVASADAAKNGCPLPPPDRDSDGIADASDACPDEAGVADADPARNGCPDRDHDHDGIANTEDACPNDAGPASRDPKRNGCPKAIVTGNQIKILDQVKFKSASTRIQPGPESAEVLMAVRAILVDQPNLKKVRVEGHTDSVGKAASNRRLSAGRAASVVKWLVEHGIDSGRLEAEGFGPDRPLASNATPAGRKENRRVEFHLVETAAADAPAGAGAPTPAATAPTSVSNATPSP